MSYCILLFKLPVGCWTLSALSRMPLSPLASVDDGVYECGMCMQGIPLCSPLGIKYKDGGEAERQQILPMDMC